MECNWNSDLPWFPGGEQDFPLGAKATPYLPSATEFDIKYDTSELPDWMESREILGLPDDGQFNDIRFQEQMEFDIKLKANKAFLDTEDDFSQTIRPEDMLVPLSELEPEKYAPQAIGAHPLAPQGIGAHTLSAVSSIPKIAVLVNKVAIPEQNLVPGFSPDQAPLQFDDIQPLNSSYQNSEETMQPIGEVPNCNADELLNELVYMATREPNGLSNLITSFDSSLVQAGMDDLLSQLESGDDNKVEPLSLPIEVLSPVSDPSPVPSVGSLSPQSTVDRSFHQLSPSVSVPSPVPSVGSLSPRSTGDCSFHQLSPMYVMTDSSQPENDKGTFFSLLSPSEDSLPVSSPVVADDEDSGNDYSSTEMHSYSRSPRKSKANHKRSGGAYPESRKERKKEQNKQAALRYRQKKKQEDDVYMAKIREEEERQKQLKAKYTNLKQELTYLKKIMREVLIAKGSVSPDAFKKK